MTLALSTLGHQGSPLELDITICDIVMLRERCPGDTCIQLSIQIHSKYSSLNEFNLRSTWKQSLCCVSPVWWWHLYSLLTINDDISLECSPPIKPPDVCTECVSWQCSQSQHTIFLDYCKHKYLIRELFSYLSARREQEEHISDTLMTSYHIVITLISN